MCILILNGRVNTVDLQKRPQTQDHVHRKGDVYFLYLMSPCNTACVHVPHYIKVHAVNSEQLPWQKANNLKAEDQARQV